MRLETGVVQCDDDWPGIFIRGDNAIGLAIMLEPILEKIDDKSFWLKRGFEGLLELLKSCDIRNNPKVQKVTFQEDK